MQGEQVVRPSAAPPVTGADSGARVAANGEHESGPEAVTIQPTAPKKRIVLLDVLRGFALAGVLITNMAYTAGTRVVPTFEFPATDLFDPWVKLILNTWFFGRPRALFSFLFGLGFAMQIMRAQEKGAPFILRFIRRMTWLLIFGLINMVFLWFGDILHIYAVMGIVLLAFRHSKDITLVTIGIILTVIPLARIQVPLFGPRASEVAETRQARLEIFSQGSYVEVVREHLRMSVDRHAPQEWSARIAIEAFGYFLIGYFVGRRKVFANLSRYRKTFGKLLLAGLAVGLASDVVYVMGRYLGFHWSPAQAWVALPLIRAGGLAKACFYLSAIALLFRLSWWRKKLEIFAPLGRMALTNYLMQSVMITFVLYGFGLGLGLIGLLSPLFQVLASIALVGLQIILSKWWLARFRFGPVEWLWRSLTYQKWQPLRL